MSRSGPTPRRAWQPLERATFADPEGFMAASGWDIAHVTVWMNDRYQVYRRAIRASGLQPAMVHLSIKRRDKKPVHDWRHLQQIKNELVGPRCEAIELYPAEHRLVDEANQYHLYACADPEVRFPVGSPDRAVGDVDDAAAVGARQRPFEDGLNVDDLALIARAAAALAEIDDSLDDALRHLNDTEIARIRQVAPRYTIDNPPASCERCGISHVNGEPVEIVDGRCADCDGFD